nr:ribonuclease H-like domain-containing protein [Tanacetum cinerariifolium]
NSIHTVKRSSRNRRIRRWRYNLILAESRFKMSCSINKDTFKMKAQDFLTRHIFLRCDSSGDLYPVTKPLILPTAFMSTSSTTWHQRLDHPGNEVLRSLNPHDIILTASSIPLLQQIVDSLHTEFDMTDLGALNYFLGISAVRHPTGLFLSQKKILLYTAVLQGGFNILPLHVQICYAVQQVCLYMHDLREPHFGALKHILRYVQGTLELGLHLYASATTSLVGYTDADWEGCPSTRRSTSGYCVFLGDNLLSWSAKRQNTISRSSAEAEYRGVANVVVETAWIRNLLHELYSPLLTATLVYCDNFSAVYMSANPVQHQQTKHIEIDIHFVRDMVKAGHVRVLHVPSCYQYADIFTKGLPLALFVDFRSSLSVRLPPTQTAGAY